MKVLVIGSGGRDHAIAWKFAQSKRVKKVFVAHGNAGIASIATCVAAKTPEEMVEFAVKEKVDLMFVGPEGALCKGIANQANTRGIPIVGPSFIAAGLERSKCDTKRKLRALGIPVPEFEVFTDPDAAEDYATSRPYPVVVKADGPCFGKGSLVCEGPRDAAEAIRSVMVEREFGVAGERVDIEERLYGRELSFFAATDGYTVVPFEGAQDFKRARDGDKGKNSGGMGSYSPHPWLSPELTKLILRRVANPLIRGLREKYGIVYKGILYLGLMLVEEKGEIIPYVLEINIRLGDPEAQAILPRLENDLVEVSEAIIGGTLKNIQFRWDPRYFLCLMGISGPCKGYKGYPDRYKIGLPIEGIEDVDPSCLVFHSGTERKEGKLVSTGGRVISVVAPGVTLEAARLLAYQEMEKIQFLNKFCRSDIGQN